MTIKKTVVATAFLMAMGLSSSGFALSKPEPEVLDGDAVTIECVTLADVDLMTDEEKGELTLPVCEDVIKNAEETPTS